MKAVILAGGLGTRLRPLTYTRPKPLLPVINKPHIDHVLEHLSGHGVDSVVLTTSYMSDAFDDVVERSRRARLEMVVTREEEPLDTAGAIKNVQDVVGDDEFLAVNVDIMTTADLTELIDFHRSRAAEATILLTPVDDPSRYGVVPTDLDGKVTEFIEKPEPGTAPTNNINAGVYVLDPAILERIPARRPVNIEREVFPQLAGTTGSLYAHVSHEYWIDIGTPMSYLQANIDALERTGSSVLTADGARVAPGARVSSTCLGRGSEVRAGALVERCVLLDEARVGEGATIRDSILGEGASVAPGGLCESRVLEDGASLGADE